MDLDTLLARAPVVPVLTLDDPTRAVPLARALAAGGLPVLEVTLRTEGALESVRAIGAEVPEAVVGVGTVRRPEQLRQARAAGAAYAVSPGLRIHLLEAARDVSLPFLPGVATPTEVMLAADEGVTVLKYFPAEPQGGVRTLKALAPVFPEIRFCPTGGIDAGNLAAYLALANVLCVGGSWVAPKDAVAARDWARIEALAAEAAAFRPPRAG